MTELRTKTRLEHVAMHLPIGTIWTQVDEEKGRSFKWVMTGWKEAPNAALGDGFMTCWTYCTRWPFKKNWTRNIATVAELVETFEEAQGWIDNYADLQVDLLDKKNPPIIPAVITSVDTEHPVNIEAGGVHHLYKIEVTGHGEMTIVFKNGVLHIIDGT